MIPKVSMHQMVLRGMIFLFMLSTVPTLRLNAQVSGWSQPYNVNTDISLIPRSYSMVVTPEGKVFVVWESRNQPPDDFKAQLFLTSYDGAAWWRPVAITSTGSMDQTPDIALDTLGQPHVVWCEYGSSEILYQYFDGVRWSLPVNVSQTPGQSFCPRIAIDRTNTVHVVWHDDTPGDFSVLYRSFNPSTGWSPIEIISDPAHNGDFPRLAVDSHNDVHVVFTRFMPPNSTLDVFYTVRRAGVWSPIDRLTNDSLASQYPDIALDRNDVPVVAWEQRFDNTSWPPPLRICLSQCQLGGTWSTPLAIEDTIESANASIAVDRENGLHAVWHLRNRAADYYSVLYSERSPQGAWSNPVDIGVPSTGLGAFAPIIRSDTCGQVHVLWIARSAVALYYTRHSIVVALAANNKINPREFLLMQNYPNPFNGITVITYSLPRKESISLKIIDIVGREVKVLVRGEQGPGKHVATLDAGGLSSGVYFYRLETTRESLTKRMVLLR